MINVDATAYLEKRYHDDVRPVWMFVVRDVSILLSSDNVSLFCSRVQEWKFKRGR